MLGEATHESASQEHPDSHTESNGPPGNIVVYLNESRRIALADIDTAAFSQFHVKICLVAGIGFFTDAYDLFAIAIAVVMLGFVYGADLDASSNLPILTPTQSVALKLSTPVGNVAGQLLFGWLADTLGRKRMYGVELMIIVVATFGQAISGQGPGLNVIYILIFWRVILGIGVGGDYPLSAIITSEFAPAKTRGRLMTAVFAFQGFGQLAAALVGIVVVTIFKDAIERSIDMVDYTWRLLIGLGSIPAMIALYLRLTVPETPRFTMDIDHQVNRAAQDIRNALENRNYNIYVDSRQYATASRVPAGKFIAHFKKLENLKVLFGTAYSWFALDVVFYILTFDSVSILNSIGLGNEYEDAYKSLLNLCAGNIILITGGYIPGFFVSFLFIDILGRKPVQLMGFVILTILFLIMGFGYDILVGSHISGHRFLALYCVANFFQNFGPNTTTFIVPGEIFPTRYRCTAHGISAACGKLGAVVAQIIFAMAGSRLDIVLKVLSFVMMTGIFSTLLVPGTKKRTLEDLCNENETPAAASQS